MVEFVRSAGSKVTALGNRLGRPVMSSSVQLPASPGPAQFVATPRVNPALLQLLWPHQDAIYVSFAALAGAEGSATASMPTISRAPVASRACTGIQPESVAAWAGV